MVGCLHLYDNMSVHDMGICVPSSPADGLDQPNTWKDGASDVGTDQDRERYRVKVALQSGGRPVIGKASLWLPAGRVAP